MSRSIKTSRPGGVGPKPRGFTMIEMVIASAILLILMGIAVATFGGFTRARSETSAEVTLTSVLTAERSYFSAGNRAYTTGSFASLPEGLTITTGASTGPKVVSAHHPGGDPMALALALLAENGSCWYLVANAVGASDFGPVTPVADCVASDANIPSPPA